MFHRSAKGKVVNFDELMHKNAKTIAVGNANLNARGDLIGPGGQVIETAEQRNAQSNDVVTTTSKVSIQSEIASLKAARSQWPASEVVADAEPVQAVVEPIVETPAESVDPVEPTAKKARKITESE